MKLYALIKNLEYNYEQRIEKQILFKRLRHDSETGEPIFMHKNERSKNYYIYLENVEYFEPQDLQMFKNFKEFYGPSK